MNKKRIAIFASGNGTNMERITQYFASGDLAEVVLVVCNNKGAGVIERAHRIGIPLIMINRGDFYETDHLSKELLTSGIDLIVLAGFLWLVPEHLIRTFPKKIINIHPALLPLFGGKGMYGMFVHEAVIRSGAKQTGITIHYVNEQYDEGGVIFQKAIPVHSSETPQQLANRIHELEYTWFPKVIEDLLQA